MYIVLPYLYPVLPRNDITNEIQAKINIVLNDAISFSQTSSNELLLGQ